MAHARTWRLGLNLDHFNTLLMGLKTTRERADFLEGMCFGMNILGARKNASRKWMEGYFYGSEMREETEAYRETRRANGVKGGRPPKKPYGSEMETIAEPRHNPNEQQFFKDQSTSPSAQHPATRERAPKEKKINPSRGEDFELFLAHYWQPYPGRIDQKTGERMGKGKQTVAYTRAVAWLKREGGTWADLELVVRAYHHHPNVKKGFVQLAEVFLGEEGHWMECASRLSGDGQLRDTLDGRRDRGLQTLPPAGGNTGTEARPVLEASGTYRG